MKFVLPSIYCLMLLLFGACGDQNHQILFNTADLLTFYERQPDNMGEIDSEAIALKRWSWNQDLLKEVNPKLTQGVHYTLEGTVPQGLDFWVEITGKREILLHFDGQAQYHHVNDSVEDLTFTLLKEAFLEKSPKALREEKTVYPLRIQFGQGFPVSGVVPESFLPLTLEVERTGETIKLKALETSFETETLFEVGDIFEIRVQNHPQDLCCFVKHGRGVMQDQGGIADTPKVLCQTPGWSAVDADNFLHIDSMEVERTHLRTAHNGFGEFIHHYQMLGQNASMIDETIATPNQSLLSENYFFETSDFVLPASTQDSTQEKLENGSNVLAWISLDPWGHTQVHLKLMHRNHGVLHDDWVTQNSMIKSKLFIQKATRDTFYLFWVEASHKLRMAYFDGKTLHQYPVLFDQGAPIDTVQAQATEDGEVLVAWTMDSVTKRLYFNTLTNGQAKQSLSSSPLSMTETSVESFDVSLSSTTKRIVWTQADPVFTSQHNIYQAYQIQNQDWVVPSQTQNYITSEPAPISNLRAVSHVDQDEVFLVWGSVNASDQYHLKMLTQNGLYWSGLETIFVSPTHQSTPAFHMHRNQKNQMLFTLAHPGDSKIYRRTYDAGQWSNLTHVPTLNLDEVGAYEHQSTFNENGYGVVVWEGRKNDAYHLLRSEIQIGNSWVDPITLDQAINPPADNYPNLGHHFVLKTSQHCGASEIVWTQKVNTSFGYGNQIFITRYQ